MAQDPEEALPPYFGISPDEALAELGPPVGTRDLAAIAETCVRGRDDLASRGHEADGRKTLRLFSTWEITRYLIPVAQAHFRRVLRQNPALPQGRTETAGGAKWFTLDEVLRLRAHFAAEGSRAKPYAPWRPAGLPAKVAAIANFKGGVGKTSMAAHLAMSAALDGYRVLVVDLDSQGSMTSIFGGRVASRVGHGLPAVARDYALGLQAENRRRVERGDAAAAPRRDPRRRAGEDPPPTSSEDPLAEHRPDRRPAEPLLGRVPDPGLAHVPARLEALGGARAAPSSATACSTRYDLVILDTPPALGYLTINGLTAADILLVPLGASFLEFDSTGRFFDMLHSTFASIEDGENMAARALGRPEIRFEWDAVRAVVTRYDAGQQAELAALMQAYFGRTLSPFRQDFTALVGQAGEQAGGIYEADYRDFNRETYARGRQTFDATYAAFKKLLLAAWRRDELEAAAATAPRPRRRPPDGPPPPDPRFRHTLDVPRAEHAPAASPSPALSLSPTAPIARVAAEAAGAAALQELTETVARARDTGRMVLDLPLDAIAPDHLARDRLPAEDAEMAALRESIRLHGQRTPIEVTPLAEGGAPCPTASSPAGAACRR